jgi:serine/threonine protein kinase
VCHPKEKVVVARLTVPVSLAKLKNEIFIDRWYEVDIDGYEASSGVPLVRIALEFNYHPSRIVNSVESVYQKYHIVETIGSGVSVVKKAVNKYTKKEYAIKFLQKEVKGQAIPRMSFDNEIALLKTISHPNIVQLYESMEDQSTIYLVMELIIGSDLYDIADKIETLLPSSVSALIQQVISALNYLHSRGIVHRDIKPENIILDYQNNTVKLTDFGSAKIVDKTDEGAVAGTIEYMAPEVLTNMARGARNLCDKPVDIWSIGIITYLLICGLHPFDSGTSSQNIIKRIIKGKYSFPSPFWDKVPKDCKDFIKRCLVVDPKKRATAAKLMKHPFITKDTNRVIFSGRL